MFRIWPRRVLALAALEAGAASDVFNLGNGHGFSVRQVVDTVSEITDNVIPIVIGDRRSGDPATLISDATRARDVLGWTPRITDLKYIIRTAWAWHQRRALQQT